MRNSQLFILLFTAALSAFGPFVTDLYLPALPILGKIFNTSVSMAQLSLTVSLVGLAAGQLLVGPLSDKYGRKNPLLLSLLVFILSTIGCICAWNIESFIFFRLVQGFAGAGGIVISKSIAVDLYESDALSHFLSLLAVINGLAPIIAPLAGGLLLKYTDWRGIFEVLLLIGFVIFIATLIFTESLAPHKRIKENIFGSFRTFGVLLQNRKFLYFTLALGFSMGLFFSYLSASPFIFQTFYSVSPLTYSIFFAINAVGFLIGSRLTILFSNFAKALIFGSTISVLLTTFMSVSLIFHASVFVVQVGFFMLLMVNAIILPAATAAALNLERANAGSASAVLGSFQFIMGGIVSPLVGIGNVMYASAFMLVICSALCWFFIRKAIKI